MKEGYISISEFAKRAGVSRQAVYKRLSTDLTTEFKMIDNQKMIKITALQYFNVNQQDNQADNSLQHENEDKISRELVNMLRDELKAKDKQIENLEKQLSQTLTLLDQQQRLQAITQQKLEKLEALPDTAEEPQGEESEPTKTNIWQRIFKHS
jgi:AcrR family transcriptional regulator